jgi:hypothetical protein
MDGAPDRRHLRARARQCRHPGRRRAWEKEREAFYELQGLKIAVQITIRTMNGLRGRVDVIFRDPVTGKIRIKGTQASLKPIIRKKQQEFFDDLRAVGGIVAGEGKQWFPGGTKVPKTKFELDSPKEATNVHRPN